MATPEVDIFQKINNAIFDLQNSDFQSYSRPVKVLARLLEHEDLQPINEELTRGADLERFLEASAATQVGMIGSAELVWPDDERETLGLTLLLIHKFAADPNFMADFGHTYCGGSSKIMVGIHGITRQIIVPFARDYKSYVYSRGAPQPRVISTLSSKVFIVHGHDGEARETVARYLSVLGLEPIILHEQANRGRTIIEKVEASSDVGFAVVLLTPDDEGRSKKGGELTPRARQNVLLELGYFMGRLGRDRVCALKRGELEIPNDFAGVVWTELDSSDGWKLKLGKELQAAGHVINWERVFGR